MRATWGHGRSRRAIRRPAELLALAAALLLAACGAPSQRAAKQDAPFQSAEHLSLNATCAQWGLASSREQRSFTDRLYGAGPAAAAGARSDVPPAELRLLISLHCAGGNAAGTPLGLIVINAVVGTLGAGGGHGG
jgi:hypothetical protein